MSEPIRLLVRVDDAGTTWESNIGCYRACTDGIARSVEVMMPGAWVPHAASLFNERPDIDIGIHLTLTSEWDAVKWRPLTDARSLVDDNGNFYALLTPRTGDPRPCLSETTWSIGDIAREFRAQIELGRQVFRNATHISSHMLRHFREFHPSVGEVIKHLCREFGLMDDPFGHGLPRIQGYPGFPRDAKHRTAAFMNEVSFLSPGTYIFIDHPAVASETMADVGHVGYEDVREDRVSCLETLTSVELMTLIEQLGIELIGYRDL